MPVYPGCKRLLARRDEHHPDFESVKGTGELVTPIREMERPRLVAVRRLGSGKSCFQMGFLAHEKTAAFVGNT